MTVLPTTGYTPNRVTYSLLFSRGLNNAAVEIPIDASSFTVLSADPWPTVEAAITAFRTTLAAGLAAATTMSRTTLAQIEEDGL